MGWAELVSRNGMGRNRTGPIDIFAQMGRAQAESGGHRIPQHQKATSTVTKHVDVSNNMYIWSPFEVSTS